MGKKGIIVLLSIIFLVGWISGYIPLYYHQALSYYHDMNYKPPVKSQPKMEHSFLLTYQEIPVDSRLNITSLNTILINRESKEPYYEDATINATFFPKASSQQFKDILLTYSNAIAQVSYENKVYVTTATIVDEASPNEIVGILRDSLVSNSHDVKVYSVYEHDNSLVYKGYKIVDNENSDVSYIVSREGKNTVVIVYAPLGNVEDAKRIVRELGKGLPSSVKSEIWTLPKDPPRDCNLIYLKTMLLNESYAESRGYSEWAKLIVGHYVTLGVYRCSNYTIEVGFFDLNNVKLARKVYDELYLSDIKKYVSLARVLGQKVEITSVKGYTAAYLTVGIYDYQLGDELNFRVGYYVIAVDGMPPVGESILKEFARSMQA